MQNKEPGSEAGPLVVVVALRALDVVRHGLDPVAAKRGQGLTTPPDIAPPDIILSQHGFECRDSGRRSGRRSTIAIHRVGAIIEQPSDVT